MFIHVTSDTIYLQPILILSPNDSTSDRVMRTINEGNFVVIQSIYGLLAKLFHVYTIIIIIIILLWYQSRVYCSPVGWWATARWNKWASSKRGEPWVDWRFRIDYATIASRHCELDRRRDKRVWGWWGGCIIIILRSVYPAFNNG